MTYDRREIMKAAWALVRQARELDSPLSTRALLRNALRTAWMNAKDAARMALWQAQQLTLSPVVRAIRDEIAAIESKDRWTTADRALWDQLRANLAAAA